MDQIQNIFSKTLWICFQRVLEASFSDSFGVSEASDRQIEHLDIIDKDGNLCIMIQIARTKHIKSEILYNKLKDVGKIEPYSKKIILNSDKKRYWEY